MSGLIADGDEVCDGQVLAVLEADGERTEIKAPAAGRITKKGRTLTLHSEEVDSREYPVPHFARTPGGNSGVQMADSSSQCSPHVNLAIWGTLGGRWGRTGVRATRSAAESSVGVRARLWGERGSVDTRA
ncbi:MAG: hypothetical protein E6I62_06630 [Chloroflexi bacterium]|nr:MAG: hypothetical protein E6I62_06630 [Chloroflexota bacterium]